MAVQAYRVANPRDGETAGAILVCTTTNTVLPLPITAFEDADDAEDFIEWHRGQSTTDLRSLDAEELGNQLLNYRRHVAANLPDLQAGSR